MNHCLRRFGDRSAEAIKEGHEDLDNFKRKIYQLNDILDRAEVARADRASRNVAQSIKTLMGKFDEPSLADIVSYTYLSRSS